VDVYFFSTIDQRDPRKAEYWYPVGWVWKDAVLTICPQPRQSSPSGAQLWTPAYVIPNDVLESPESLHGIAQKPRDQPQGRNELSETEITGREQVLDALFERLGLNTRL